MEKTIGQLQALPTPHPPHASCSLLVLRAIPPSLSLSSAMQPMFGLAWLLVVCKEKMLHDCMTRTTKYMYVCICWVALI